MPIFPKFSMNYFISLVFCLCPRCGKQGMFKYPVLYFWKFIVMHDSCPKCSLNFHPEPGFYLGAMYISYVITSFVFLFAGLFVTFYFNWSFIATFSLLGVLALLILPYSARVSRVFWLALNEKY